MKIRWLVVAALMITLSGAAFAQTVVYRDARVYPSDYDRDRLWNPLTGYRPWLEPQGYSVVVPESTVVRRVVVPREVRVYDRDPSYWRAKYYNDIGLGGYPAGYPSYTYKYYHP